MEDLTREFDPLQTHVRHYDCVCDRDNVKYMIKERVRGSDPIGGVGVVE